MKNETNNNAVRLASKRILTEHMLDHKAKAEQSRSLAVYAYLTAADPGYYSAEIVEATIRDSVEAEARYHEKQTLRFELALQALEEEPTE